MKHEDRWKDIDVKDLFDRGLINEIELEFGCPYCAATGFEDYPSNKKLVELMGIKRDILILFLHILVIQEVCGK